MALTCGCDLDVSCDFFQKTTPTARKVHRCEECGREIQPGQKYVRIFGVWDGDASIHKMCSTCDEIGLGMGCHIYGRLFSDLRDSARERGGDLPMNFFDGLSPDAVDLIQERVLDRTAVTP